MIKLSKSYSMIVYWFENIFIIIFFTFYEFFLLPLAYFKTLMNIMTSTEVSLLRKMGMMIIWVFIGLPFEIKLLVKDCLYLIKILLHS